MTDIRHIVFDLGRVLVRWEPELPYLRLIPDPAERRRFLDAVCNGDWLVKTDRGTSWADAETALIAEHPQDEAMIRAFREHWHEMTPGIMEETAEIVETLAAAGYDLTALTNFAADTFEECLPRFPVLSRFRGVTVSARVGLVKPEAAIYERHAADFGLGPPATLFFDDKLVNVEAARAAGWHAEQFKSAEQLRIDLERYGVFPLT